MIGDVLRRLGARHVALAQAGDDGRLPAQLRLGVGDIGDLPSAGSPASRRGLSGPSGISRRQSRKYQFESRGELPIGELVQPVSIFGQFSSFPLAGLNIANACGFSIILSSFCRSRSNQLRIFVAVELGFARDSAANSLISGISARRPFGGAFPSEPRPQSAPVRQRMRVHVHTKPMKH